MEISKLQVAVWSQTSAGPEARTIAERDAQLDPKLVSSAHQFEASLMQELLKPLNSSQIFGEDEEAGAATLASADEGSGGALMSFGSEALAKALSEKGGMGISRRVLDHFEDLAGKEKQSHQSSKTEH